MLGFIAFQFVVNDNMPKTGEESKLHRFMNLANVFIALVGGQSILVYKIAKDDLSSFLRPLYWCPDRLLRFLGLEEKNKKDLLSVELKERQPSVTGAGDNAPKLARARESSVVDYDGVTSAEEKGIIIMIDRIALTLFPIAFSVESWFIFDDKVHEIIMGFFVSLTLAGIFASFLLARLETRKVEKGEWRGDVHRHYQPQETRGDKTQRQSGTGLTGEI
jgi:hypothetical protein